MKRKIMCGKSKGYFRWQAVYGIACRFFIMLYFKKIDIEILYHRKNLMVGYLGDGVWYACSARMEYVCKRDNVRVFLSVGDKDGLNLKSAVKFTLEMLSGNIRGGELKDEEWNCIIYRWWC